MWRVEEGADPSHARPRFLTPPPPPPPFSLVGRVQYWRCLLERHRLPVSIAPSLYTKRASPGSCRLQLTQYLVSALRLVTIMCGQFTFDFRCRCCGKTGCAAPAKTPVGSVSTPRSPEDGVDSSQRSASPDSIFSNAIAFARPSGESLNAWKSRRLLAMRARC